MDSREASSAKKIATGLVEKGVNVKTEMLEKGDYILSDQCAVERKTVNDFVYTLTRRYLFEQLFRLKDVYPKSLIVLEGYLPIIYKYSSISPASVWGAMFNLAKNGIAIVNTASQKETVDFLYTAARQEQIVEKRSAVVHAFKVNSKEISHREFRGHRGNTKSRPTTHELRFSLFVQVDPRLRNVAVGRGPCAQSRFPSW